MSTGQQQHGPAQRLNVLVEQSLAAAEERTANGDPPSASELNGLRRMVERLEADEQLAKLRELTTG